jgi:hypothetical protein
MQRAYFPTNPNSRTDEHHFEIEISKPKHQWTIKLNIGFSLAAIVCEKE